MVQDAKNQTLAVSPLCRILGSKRERAAEETNSRSNTSDQGVWDTSEVTSRILRAIGRATGAHEWRAVFPSLGAHGLGRQTQVSVILNVWSDHVSCYKPGVGQLPAARTKEWHDVILKVKRGETDEHKYDEMRELEWPLLIGARQDKETCNVRWGGKSGGHTTSGPQLP